jgi:hypothetical protein
VVVVEAGDRPVVVGGDVAVWFGELDEPHTEGQLRRTAAEAEKGGCIPPTPGDPVSIPHDIEN